MFDFERAFDPAQLTARGATVAVIDVALEIKGTAPDSDSGVAALRAQARLEWDAAAGRFPNRPDCDVFAGPGYTYRSGWGVQAPRWSFRLRAQRRFAGTPSERRRASELKGFKDTAVASAFIGNTLLCYIALSVCPQP